MVEEKEWSFPGILCGKLKLKGLQCGAPEVAKLVYNSNNYGLWLWFVVLITRVAGGYKPTWLSWALHRMENHRFSGRIHYFYGHVQ